MNAALIRMLAWEIGMLCLLPHLLSMGVFTNKHWQTSGRLVQQLNVCTVCFNINVTLSMPIRYYGTVATCCLSKHKVVGIASDAIRNAHKMFSCSAEQYSLGSQILVKTLRIRVQFYIF